MPRTTPNNEPTTDILGVSGATDADLLGRLRAAHLQDSADAAWDELVARHRAALDRLAARLGVALHPPLLADVLDRARTELAAPGPEVAVRPVVLAALSASTRQRPTGSFSGPFDTTLGSAWALLTSREQVLVWHVMVEDRPADEVAHLLGVPVGDIDALARRCTLRMRTLFLASEPSPLAARAFDSSLPTLLVALVLGADTIGYLDGRGRYRAPNARAELRPVVRSAAAVLAVGLVGTALMNLARPNDDATRPAAAHDDTVTTASPAPDGGDAPGVPQPTPPTGTSPNGSSGPSDTPTPSDAPTAASTDPSSPKPADSSGGGGAAIGGGSTQPSTAPTTPATTTPSQPPTQADIAISATSSELLISWKVDGVPSGGSSSVRITAPFGTTLDPRTGDCTGAGTSVVTCTATAGAPSGSVEVSARGGRIGLEAAPVSGLDDPKSDNNSTSVQVASTTQQGPVSSTGTSPGSSPLARIG